MKTEMECTLSKLVDDTKLCGVVNTEKKPINLVIIFQGKKYIVRYNKIKTDRLQGLSAQLLVT